MFNQQLTDFENKNKALRTEFIDLCKHVKKVIKLYYKAYDTDYNSDLFNVDDYEELVSYNLQLDEGANLSGMSEYELYNYPVTYFIVNKGNLDIAVDYNEVPQSQVSYFCKYYDSVDFSIPLEFFEPDGITKLKKVIAKNKKLAKKFNK